MHTPLGLVQTVVQTDSGWLSFSKGVENWIKDAAKQLEKAAREMGGDAIIGLRYTSNAGALLVISTAVKRG